MSPRTTPLTTMWRSNVRGVRSMETIDLKSDLGSLAVFTAVVENMASSLHIVVGKKALGFETNGQDIEKNDRDIE
ncbi:hypothetical protein Tco_0826566 [Tanacetum coccineum]